MIAKQRLYLNFEKTAILPHGHPEARFLFAAAGQVISEADALKYGLTSPALHAAPKEAAPIEDREAVGNPDTKEAAPPENKEAASPENKEAPKGKPKGKSKAKGKSKKGK